MFKKPTPFKALEAELADLTRRHDAVTVRLDQAVRELAAANAERRRLLTETDTEDPRAVAKADETCRAADNRRTGLEDALRALNERLTSTSDQLAAVREAAERQRIADELERRAGAIDAAAADLQAAMLQAGRAYEVLVAAIWCGGLIAPLGSAETTAAPIVRAGIRSFAPQLVPVSEIFGWPAPEADARTAAGKDQSGPLRALAGHVRAGEARPVLPEAAAAFVTVTIPETRVVLREPIFYLSADGRPIHVPEGSNDVPVPVAEAAIAQGIGHPPDTADAKQVLGVLAQLTGSGGAGLRREPREDGIRSGPPWTDIGVDLSLIVEAGRERLAGERAQA